MLAVAAPLMTALYVEGGLTVISQRLRWESEGRGLRPSEWLLPGAAITVLVVAVAATVGAVGGTFRLLATAEIPTISDIAAELTELAP